MVILDKMETYIQKVDVTLSGTIIHVTIMTKKNGRKGSRILKGEW
jgi:hypothetical protein